MPLLTRRQKNNIFGLGVFLLGSYVLSSCSPIVKEVETESTPKKEWVINPTPTLEYLNTPTLPPTPEPTLTSTPEPTLVPLSEAEPDMVYEGKGGAAAVYIREEVAPSLNEHYVLFSGQPLVKEECALPYIFEDFEAFNDFLVGEADQDLGTILTDLANDLDAYIPLGGSLGFNLCFECVDSGELRYGIGHFDLEIVGTTDDVDYFVNRLINCDYE